MAEFNICRREVQKEGEPVRYCTERITKANALNWGEKCRAKLPFWPADDKPAEKPRRESSVRVEEFEEVA